MSLRWAGKTLPNVAVAVAYTTGMDLDEDLTRLDFKHGNLFDHKWFFDTIQDGGLEGLWKCFRRHLDCSCWLGLRRGEGVSR